MLAAQDYAFADPNSSYNKCLDSFSDVAASNENLEVAARDHASSLQSSVTDTDWTIGYSETDKNAYKTACEKYNESLESDDRQVFWMELDTPVQMMCDWNNVTGRTAEFYGIGSCLANTPDCRAWDSTDLVTQVWAQTEGLNCRALGGDDPSEKNNENDNETAANESDAPENLAPGENKDQGERLPFLTDDDVKCMQDTADFLLGETGLTSAVQTFESSQLLKEEDAGVKVLGYPEEAAKAMKSACELNKAIWSFVKSGKFTCVIQGMETISMHVHNFGKCLVSTQECSAMDPISLLRADLVDLGYNCWVDDEVGDEGSTASENANAGDVEQVGNNDENDEKTTEDKDADMNQEIADMLDDLGLSESDEQCMSDSAAIKSGHPDLDDAVEKYASSMSIENTSAAEVKLGFSEDYTEQLKSICTDDEIGGYFSLVEKQEFDCTMASVQVQLIITDMASCLANTDECRNMNPLVLMEGMWQSMGLSCDETAGGDDEDKTPPTTDNSDKDDNKNENPNGLKESEVVCMSESTSFIENSSTLSNATEFYQKSVQMTDPTKLGYSSASSSEMEQACDEQGGLWSFIESEDVTCTINGRDRCIHVYNFGNCLANNDECQSMDPFVLVKGFFSEVLGFTCRAKCDKHSAGHPSATPQNAPSKDKNLSSQQSSGGNPSSGSKLPKFTTMAIVLAAVAAIGLIGFLRYRGRHGIDRNARSSYEMTDISDLGFQVFT